MKIIKNFKNKPLIILSPASPATLIVAKSAAILLDSNCSASNLRALATTIYLFSIFIH